MNILITVLKPWAIHNNYGAALETRHGERLARVGTVHHASTFTNSEGLADAMSKCHPEVMLTFWSSPKVTMEIRRRFPEFKYLCNLGGGMRHVVDRDVIADGLIATNWGNGISYSIAEASLMMALSALRRTTRIQFDIHQRGLWPAAEDVRPKGLFYRKVGLHGLGLIAQEFAKLLKPFHCEVSAYSPHCPDSIFEELGIRRVNNLKDLYAQNDVVSVHASKTQENFHIVNKDILAAMQDDAILVNTARGAVIDTDALVAELKTGRIHASLDVFEQEPLPVDHPLRGLENCQLISHHGGPTPDQRRFLGDIAVENVERYARGEPVKNRVTAEQYDLMT
jgi:phosphoglycerate dehydrogenase-like enzyme